jgi:uncharacterized membrane protein
MNLPEYIGKFHPLAVHLPIGVSVAFLVIAVFISRARLTDALPIIRLLLLVSALSAVFSSVSGYLLFRSGEYDVGLVTRHQVLGIALTLISWGLFFGIEKLLNAQLLIYRGVLILVLSLLILTGHAGGTLTHGSGFLNPPSIEALFASDVDESRHIDINTNAYQAVSVIMQSYCYSCHGKQKQKGKLRLDGKTWIMEGGKSGGLIQDEKMLVKRIKLPYDDEDHMPPKEKKQPDEDEINFLIWWVERGANFDLTLAELDLPDSLFGILSSKEIVPDHVFVPPEEVAPADPEMLNKLPDLNVIVTKIGLNSNYLSASFVNVSSDDAGKAAEILTSISPQLIWLNVDFQNLDPKAWANIGMLKNIRKLSAANSNLNDENIISFVGLDDLASLNATGTELSNEGLLKLKGLENLQYVYLYDTRTDRDGFRKIHQAFPSVKIDSGNYSVPTLSSDTTVFKK